MTWKRPPASALPTPVDIETPTNKVNALGDVGATIASRAKLAASMIREGGPSAEEVLAGMQAMKQMQKHPLYGQLMIGPRVADHPNVGRDVGAREVPCNVCDQPVWAPPLDAVTPEQATLPVVCPYCGAQGWFTKDDKDRAA